MFPRIALPPGTRKLRIEIGNNVDVVVPPKDDTSVSVLAVEPVLGTAVELVKQIDHRIANDKDGSFDASRLVVL